MKIDNSNIFILILIAFSLSLVHIGANPKIAYAATCTAKCTNNPDITITCEGEDCPICSDGTAGTQDAIADCMCDDGPIEYKSCEPKPEEEG